MPLRVKIVRTLAEREQSLALRRIVFSEEQGVPEAIEIDEFETVATSVLACRAGRPVGTARWRTTPTGIKLERFAVLPEERRTGVGAALLKFILARIEPSTAVYLNSQEAAIPFYRRFGFRVRGRLFYEAGLPHRKMVLARQLADWSAGCWRNKKIPAETSRRD